MKYQKIMRRMMGCAAAILALTACSESEDLLSAFHSDPNAVRITAQVGKASVDGFTEAIRWALLKLTRRNSMMGI